MKIMTCSWFDTERIEEAILDGRRIVSISLGEPKEWHGKFQHKIWEFCPVGPLIRAFKRGDIDEEDYAKVYVPEVKEKIQEGIAQLKDGDVLCCWEPEGQFCHRVLLADLLVIHDIEVEIH